MARVAAEVERGVREGRQPAGKRPERGQRRRAIDDGIAATTWRCSSFSALQRTESLPKTVLLLLRIVIITMAMTMASV